MRIIIEDDYTKLSLTAAQIIQKQLLKKPDSVLGLATGSSPLGMYKNLIAMYKKGLISFKNVHSINLDEYIGLSENHPQSYHYFMAKKLFDHIDIDKKNTHIPNGLSCNLAEEMMAYEALIDRLGGQDIQILGIGENGHIGFNEPANKLELFTHVENLAESTIKANSRFFDKIDDVPKSAISMGIGSIFKAKHIVLIASGIKKAPIMKEFFDSTVSSLLPASFLKLHKNVTLIMDKESANLIEEIKNY